MNNNSGLLSHRPLCGLEPPAGCCCQLWVPAAVVQAQRTAQHTTSAAACSCRRLLLSELGPRISL